MTWVVFRLFAVTVVSALALLAEPNQSWEKLQQSLQPGKTVVVTRMTSGQVEGKLLELTADSITVKWRGKPEVVRREDVYRVRIANIRRKHTLIGMAVGTGIGAIWGRSLSRTNRGVNAAAGALFGVGFGALGGGVLPIGAPLYQVPKPPKRAPASKTGE